MNTQSEFNFEPDGSDQGYAQWLTGRRMAAKELAWRINLPLGHEVELWLFGGIRLRGAVLARGDAAHRGGTCPTPGINRGPD
jgi:hypothetical protein